MGDLIQIRDYQKKPKIETPLQEGLSIIAQAMAEMPAGSGSDALAWPGMDIQAPYMADEKDPA